MRVSVSLDNTLYRYVRTRARRRGLSLPAMIREMLEPLRDPVMRRRILRRLAADRRVESLRTGTW